MCGHEEDGAGVPPPTTQSQPTEQPTRPTQSWDVDDIYFKREAQEAGYKRDQRGFLQPYLINVSVNLRVVVDVNAWWAEYGHVESPREIRETIKSGAYDAVKTGAFGHLTHLLRVEEL
jgi:hypothetical protein